MTTKSNDSRKDNNWPHTIMKEMEVPPHLSSKFWRQASKYQFIYAITGLLLGLICIIGGIIIFIKGVTGSTSWTAKILGFESSIGDAAPGVVLFIVGLFIVIVTRLVVKIKNK